MSRVDDLEAVLRTVAANVDAMTCLEQVTVDRIVELLDEPAAVVTVTEDNRDEVAADGQRWTLTDAYCRECGMRHIHWAGCSMA